VCSVVLDEFEFFEVESKPYCREHYVQLFANSCFPCGEPILRDGVQFLEKHYHHYCFKCTKCETILQSGKFIEWDTQPLCMPCYENLPKKIRKQVEKRKKLEAKARKDKMKRDEGLS